MMAVTNAYSVDLLVRCAHATGSPGYEALARVALGQPGEVGAGAGRFEQSARVGARLFAVVCLDARRGAAIRFRERNRWRYDRETV